MAGTTLDSGTIIGGNYRIDRPIGRGGFANVYQGVHTDKNHRVAIKIFDPAAHGDEDGRRADRFRREARLVSRLQHPNTVTILDYGVDDDGTAFLVMEYIEGTTLQQLFDRHSRLEPVRAITIFVQILASLQEAHQRDIIHRDLKPANVMLVSDSEGNDAVKVLDFGIAQALRKDSEDDGEKLFVGTPRYAAPEQLTGTDLSLATDIYAVGAMLWEALVGEPMVSTNAITECVRFATSSDPWRLPDDAQVPPQLREVIERAVRKPQANRFQNASAMLRALEDCEAARRAELPEFDDDSPFAGSSGVFDPNVTDDEHRGPSLLDDDADDEFDSASNAPPPLPGASRSDTPPPTMAPTRDNPAPSGDEPELELDLPADDQRDQTEQHEPKHSPHRPDTASQHRDESDPDRDPPFDIEPVMQRVEPVMQRASELIERIGVGPAVAIAFAVVFAGLFGVVVLTVAGGSGSPDLDDIDFEAAPADDEPFELAETSPHDTDDIIATIRLNGWTIDRSRDPVEMSDYTYRALRIRSGDDTLGLRLYVAHHADAISQLERDISTPDRHLTFDHIVVKLSPDDTDARRAADELIEILKEHRTEVEQQ